MTLKITLITPPDIYENDNESLLLINPDEEEQEISTQWFGEFDSEKELNLYFYQGEPNVPWIFHAMAVSKYKYINMDIPCEVTGLLAGYILGKGGVYYKIGDNNIAAVFEHINTNRVNNIKDFFERIFRANKR
jgi:hypothetical protein